MSVASTLASESSDDEPLIDRRRERRLAAGAHKPAGAPTADDAIDTTAPALRVVESLEVRTFPLVIAAVATVAATADESGGDGGDVEAGSTEGDEVRGDGLEGVYTEKRKGKKAQRDN
ncbi:hypothetical protein BGX33_004030, partial [Mortierella sp. NVP41]